MAGTAWRRWAMGGNAVVATGLAFILLVMVNILAARHPWRWDVTRARYYALSPQTLRVLERLPADLEVSALLKADHELAGDIRSLLREYALASPRVRVEIVDPNRDLARMKDLALRYDLPEPNVVVFASGGRKQVVVARDLADYDYTPMLSGQTKRMVAFRGEQVFSSAIQTLIQPQRPVVYFLDGHGERGIDNYDQYAGYSILARTLRRDNMEVRTVRLDHPGALPRDADVLVVPGPVKRILRAEVDLLQAYLNNSGRMLLLLDSGTASGLDGLLEAWGLQVSDDYVVGQSLSGRELLVSAYGDHPVTARMKNETTVFYMPRSVQPFVATNPPAGVPADRPRVSVLAASSPQGWAELARQQNPPKFDPEMDRPGPVSVAAAVEKGQVHGMAVEIRPARLIVIGDSFFVANGAIMNGYNLDFLMNAMNWLLDREGTVAIGARETPAVRPALSRRQVQAVYLLCAGGIPAGVLVLGALVWLRRRQ